MPESIKKVLRPIYVPIANWHWRTFRAKRYHHLFDEIEKLEAKTIIEVGTWKGGRAIEMITKAQRVSEEPITYIGFDLFEDLGEEGYREELSKRPPSEVEVCKVLEATGAHIQLHRGNTLTTLPQLIATLPKADFIYIDGGHSNETVKSDWEYCKELMHEKTVVIFDDYWRNRTDGGAKLTVDAIDRTQYDVQVLPEIDCFDHPDFDRVEISFARVAKV